MSHRVALTLYLDSLIKGECEISLIHVYKNGKEIDYHFEEIGLAALKNHFGNLIPEAQKILYSLSPTKLRQNFLTTYHLSGKELDEEELEEKFFQETGKFAHNQFLKLRPYFEIIKCYTHKSKGERNFKIEPIHLKTNRPSLQFEVEKRGRKFHVQTFVSIDKTQYKLEELQIYGYFVCVDSNYYLLSQQDYKTLQWLKTDEVQEFLTKSKEFNEQLLVELDKNYPVKRGALFQSIEVSVVPQRRIYVREVSEQFLLLSPQWFYDGFLIEDEFVEKVERLKNGISYTILRNKEEENSFIDFLKSQHPNFEKQRNGHFYLPFADAVKSKWFYNFFQRVLAENIELVGMDLLQHFKFSKHPISTKFTILETTNSTIKIRIENYFGKEKISLKDIQKALWSGTHSLILSDNSLGVLNEEWYSEFALMLKHATILEENICSVSKLFAILEENKSSSETQNLRGILNDSWKQNWMHWQTDSTPLYALPAFVNVTLRAYQQKGFEWMVLMAELGAGVCLADDMGLGKTIQAICFFSYQLAKKPNGKHLIICPASLAYNWVQEWAKIAPSVQVNLYYGSNRDKEIFINSETQIIITTYSIVRNDIDYLESLLFDSILLDESHQIKSSVAQITKAIKRLHGEQRIAMSGTPLINNTLDLHSQFNFLLPTVFGSRSFFQKEYAEPIDEYKNVQKIEALKKLTAPFVLRRTKNQVAKDLPAKTETIIWCDMQEEQRNAYETVKSKIWSDLQNKFSNDGFEKSKLGVLQGLLRLRQVCNSPQLAKDEDITTTQSVKLETLLEEIELNLGSHKAIVFSQFVEMLALIKEELDAREIPYFYFDGSTPIAKRQELVNEFQSENNDTPLFLISLKAGNAGITLTSADYVFLVDPWWNAAVENQAIDRTHRIGQTKSVFAYKMVCKNTIEEKIIKLQTSKKFIADSLITEEEGFVKSLQMEDIAYLFE